MFSTSSLKRNMNKIKSKKFKSFLCFWKKEARSSFSKKVPRQEKKELADTDRISWFEQEQDYGLMNLLQLQKASRARSKIGERKKLSPLKRAPMQISLIQNSQVQELESDGETASGSYHYPRLHPSRRPFLFL